MSEYTPTTEHVRDLALRLMNADEFDAWLAKVKADAWDEGRTDGCADAVRAAYDMPGTTRTPNPYRREATR